MQRAVEGVAAVGVAARRLVVALVSVVMIPQDDIPATHMNLQAAPHPHVLTTAPAAE